MASLQFRLFFGEGPSQCPKIADRQPVLRHVYCWMTRFLRMTVTVKSDPTDAAITWVDVSSFTPEPAIVYGPYWNLGGDRALVQIVSTGHKNRLDRGARRSERAHDNPRSRPRRRRARGAGSAAQRSGSHFARVPEKGTKIEQIEEIPMSVLRSWTPGTPPV